MSNYPIYSVLGIEIEYMLVDKDTLDIRPVSDVLLKQLAGKLVNEINIGEVGISNELVLHVLELKNNGPKLPSHPTAEQFQQTILQLQPLLEELHLKLLPTGAHPWMNPLTETKRWPHGNKSIYQQFDAIFNCEGHGWSNLQSMHINLPFANDDEFCTLHNAIRLLLPLLPALAASTPILDGKKTGFLDSRLDYYGKNQQRIPSIGGSLIPEIIDSEAQYRKKILAPMYHDIAVFDTAGLLQHEWLNSRGAIAKFELMAIEIRILDTQECVNADIAIAKATHAILKSISSDHKEHRPAKNCSTKQLKALYDETIKNGFNVRIDSLEILAGLQLPKHPMSVRDAWSLLIERVRSDLDLPSQCALEHILTHGSLSERILKACRGDYNKASLAKVYHQLSDCLLHNQPFRCL